MSKPLVLVTAPVSTRSGYGNHARDICRALIESDKYDVKIQSVRWGNTPLNAFEEGNPHHEEIQKRILRQPSLEKQPDLHMHIVVPNEFAVVGKKNIGFTAGIEHTIPPAEWVEGCNRMDLNIFTSEFSKAGFENIKYDKRDQKTNQDLGVLKLEKPSEVLFEGADPEIYKETKELSEKLRNEFSKINNQFCFLFTGHWLQGNMGEDRKDAGMMLRVFLETFKNQRKAPALIMKTSGAGFSVMDKTEMLKRINQIKLSIQAEILPEVYLLHGDLTDEEMNQMYNHPKVKAHVSFTHGEGFGRPLLEASISEKIVIAPDWSGQKDFLNKNNSVLLPGSLTNVPASSLPKEMLVEGAQWFTVNYQYASQVMMDVFKRKKDYMLKAKRQAMYNRVNFTMDKMTKDFGKILDRYLPKFEEQPQQVNLKLPKLKKVKTDEPQKMKLPKLKKV